MMNGPCFPVPRPRPGPKTSPGKKHRTEMTAFAPRSFISLLLASGLLLAPAQQSLAQQPPAQQPPAQTPAQPQTQPAAPAPATVGAFNITNGSLLQVIDMLAQDLHINYVLDSSV